MPQLKGLKKLIKKIEELKLLSEEVRENLEERHEWVYSKSDRWQESAKGQELIDFLDVVENLLDEIDLLSEEFISANNTQYDKKTN